MKEEQDEENMTKNFFFKSVNNMCFYTRLYV